MPLIPGRAQIFIGCLTVAMLVGATAITWRELPAISAVLLVFTLLRVLLLIRQIRRRR